VKYLIPCLIVNITAFGANVFPPTASYSDVTNAIATAVAGDTIIFPSGASAAWSNSATVSKPLTIMGQGSTITAGTVLNNGMFYVTGVTSTLPVRITGFTFNLMDFTASGHAINILNGVALTQMRIDNNTFNFGYEQLQIGGCFGVIDHNYFRNSRKGISFTAGDTWQATASWTNLAAGTAQALFVEDNQFIDDANYPGSVTQEKIGTFNGGKLVVRYNTFDFDAISVAPGTSTSTTILTHGSAPGGVPANQGYWQQGFGARRGQSVVEIYGNVMHGRRIDFLVTLRGSANLVYSNSVTSTNGGTLRSYIYEEEIYGTGWDPIRTNWPAEDQVHNSFFWANTFGGAAQTTANFAFGENSTNFIQLGRDYWTNAPAASGGSESFTGANGASSSFPTDGITYPTSGTMTFSSSGPNAYYGYTPYAYPHPLTRAGTITFNTINLGTLVIGP